MRGRVVVMGLALVLAGCGKKPGPTPVVAGAATPEDPVEPVATAPMEAEDPSVAPRPYTADQIAAAWVTGLVVRWEVTGEGAAVSHQRWEIGETDDDGVTITYFDTDAEGADLGPGDSASNTWTELRDHATFPADRTTIESVVLDTPMGGQPASLYTVAPSEEGGPVKRYWFGTATPGAPLLHTVTVGDQVVMSLKMTERTVPE